MTSSDPPNSTNTLRPTLISRCYEVIPEAAYILKDRATHSGDLLSQVGDMEHDEKMFNIFYSILLGIDKEYGTSHNRGGVSRGTDDDIDMTMQPHGPELVTASAATYWLPAYLKKREKASGYSSDDCVKLLQPLKMACDEAMKFGDHVSTDVAKVLAKMDIGHVEFLLKNPEDLRSTLRGIVKDMKQKETGLPDHSLLPDFELLPELIPLEEDSTQIED